MARNSGLLLLNLLIILSLSGMAMVTNLDPNFFFSRNSRLLDKFRKVLLDLMTLIFLSNSNISPKTVDRFIMYPNPNREKY